MKMPTLFPRSPLADKSKLLKSKLISVFNDAYAPVVRDITRSSSPIRSSPESNVLDSPTPLPRPSSFLAKIADSMTSQVTVKVYEDAEDDHAEIEPARSVITESTVELKEEDDDFSESDLSEIDAEDAENSDEDELEHSQNIDPNSPTLFSTKIGMLHDFPSVARSFQFEKRSVLKFGKRRSYITFN